MPGAIVFTAPSQNSDVRYTMGRTLFVEEPVGYGPAGGVVTPQCRNSTTSIDTVRSTCWVTVRFDQGIA